MTTMPAGPGPGVRGTRMSRPARRAQLLTAAQEVFVAQGYHQAAMDDIAERAGVSKPVLYQHFPSKLELYLSLLDVHAESLVARVREALESTTDNRLRVAASVRAYFDFVDGDGTASEGAFRLVFESDLRNDPVVRERVERMTQGCIDAIAETIAHDTGYRADEAQLLSIGISGLMEVGARWWLSSPDRIPKERAIELLMSLAWRGISGSPRTAHDAAVVLPSADAAAGSSRTD